MMIVGKKTKADGKIKKFIPNHGKKKNLMLEALQRRNLQVPTKKNNRHVLQRDLNQLQQDKKGLAKFQFVRVSQKFPKTASFNKIQKSDDSNPEVSNFLKAYTLQITPRQNLQGIWRVVGFKRDLSKNFPRQSLNKDDRKFSFEHVGSGSAGPVKKKKRNYKFFIKSQKYLKLKETIDTQRKEDREKTLKKLKNKSMSLQRTYQYSLNKILQKQKQLMQQRKKYEFEKKCFEQKVCSLSHRIMLNRKSRNCVTSADEDEKSEEINSVHSLVSIKSQFEQENHKNPQFKNSKLKKKNGEKIQECIFEDYMKIEDHKILTNGDDTGVQKVEDQRYKSYFSNLKFQHQEI